MSEDQYDITRPAEAGGQVERQGEWLPIESAPLQKRVLVWVHLPKNPLADDITIGSRCYVSGSPDEASELGPYVEGCWWMDVGRYYAPIGDHPRVVCWMPLPEPPR